MTDYKTNELSIEVAKAIVGDERVNAEKKEKIQKQIEKEKRKTVSYQMDTNVLSANGPTYNGSYQILIRLGEQQNKKEAHLFVGELYFRFPTKEAAKEFMNKFRYGDSVTCIITKGEQ